MLSELFQHKVVGLSYHDQNIKYALISVEKNKLIVNEAQTFNTNCKAALHRLQYLLKSYPCCYIISAKKCLLEKPPKGVKSLKDRIQLVKNKIETLLGSESIITIIQKKIKGRDLSSYLCIKKASISKLLHQISGLPSPEKIITTSQALVTLDKFYFKNEIDGYLVYFDEKRVEILDIKNKSILYHQTYIQLLSNQTSFLKKFLTIIYARLQTNQVFVKPHGHCKPFISELEKEEFSKLIKIIREPYHNLEENYSNYLVEIGGALNLYQGLNQNFQKMKLVHILKTYKKPLFIQTALATLILFFSMFYWYFKISNQEIQNQTLLTNSLSKLNKVETYVNISTESSIHKLKKILVEKEKNIPLNLVTNNFLTVTDVVAWISSVYQTVYQEDPNAQFTIENLKYHYPIHDQIGSKNPKIKVTLAFLADSSQTARKIYEKIIHSKQIIDNSEKTNWNYYNNQYQISFYLKNKEKS